MVEYGIPYFEMHPISEYWFDYEDFSINAEIQIRWLYWAFNFFNMIKNYECQYEVGSNSIQNIKSLEIKEKIILINNFEIKDIKSLENWLLENNKDLLKKVKIKLLLNINEYIEFTTINKPTLTKWDD